MQSPNPEVQWRIRRRMAVGAFLHMIVISLAIFFFGNETLKDFNSVIIALIGADMSIIGAYIGAVTWSDSKGFTTK